MTEIRYYRLHEVEIDSYNLDAPVEIEKGALLLDKETKSVILQLKNTILIDDFKQISSVKIRVQGFDDAGDEIEGFNPYYYTFRDINLLGKKSFGDRTAILLDIRVRRIKVDIDRVVFVSGKIWENDKREISIPKQRHINTLSTELQEQFERDKQVFTGQQIETIRFFPQQEDDYWMCTCGRPNKNNLAYCCRCGIKKDMQFSIIDLNKVQDNLNSYSDKEKEKIANRKRTILFGFVSVVIISVIVQFLVIPTVKYNQAISHLDNKEYESAIMIFEELGNYRDSMQMINYYKAIELTSGNQFDEAIELFLVHGDYQNSDIMIKEAKYQKAVDLLATSQLDEAIEQFIELGDYRNSELILAEAKSQKAVEMSKEANYHKASEMLEASQFYEAIKLFEELGDYWNSEEMITEAKYLKAIGIMAGNQFEEAIELFLELGDYKNSEELYNESMFNLYEETYKTALELFQMNFFNQSKESFSKVRDYKDAKDFIKKIYLINRLRRYEWTDPEGYFFSIDNEVIYPLGSVLPFTPEFDEDNKTFSFYVHDQELIFNGFSLKNSTTNEYFSRGQEIPLENLK